MVNENFWRGKTVLVAGCTGFLGGWLVRRLLDYESQVVALVRSRKEDSHFFLERMDQRVIMESGSIYDHSLMRRIFERYDIQVFFHAAYGADVNRVLKEPLECFRSSAESTWNILDLFRRNQKQCISVISSTDKAYGAQDLPYREDKPLNPLHPYEVAKASQDLVAQSYGKVFGLPVAVTRCGNYFGGYDFNFTRLIPGALKSLSAGETPVLRSDGRFTRDFLYIEDAVDVQLMLAERLSRDRRLFGEAFNFSYGEQIEVIDIIRRISDLTGSSVEPLVNNRVQAEIRHMELSSEKARQILNWRPQFGFEEGLRRTVRWYQEHFSSRVLATSVA